MARTLAHFLPLFDEGQTSSMPKAKTALRIKEQVLATPTLRLNESSLEQIATPPITFATAIRRMTADSAEQNMAPDPRPHQILRSGCSLSD